MVGQGYTPMNSNLLSILMSNNLPTPTVRVLVHCLLSVVWCLKPRSPIIGSGSLTDTLHRRRPGNTPEIGRIVDGISTWRPPRLGHVPFPNQRGIFRVQQRSLDASQIVPAPLPWSGNHLRCCPQRRTEPKTCMVRRAYWFLFFLILLFGSVLHERQLESVQYCSIISS